jgi:hypothetical protein
MISRIDSKLNVESNRYKNFDSLKISDFENLFRLRDKLVVLQKYIANSLDKDSGLESTILSPIDTTSAYIWMPFVDKDFIEKSIIIDTKRNNLVMGSVSILATPIDLRVYIDFGGGDIDFRTSYQKFLQSKVFKEYIKRFENIQPSLKIFDIRWYSFIVNEDNILEILNKNIFDKKTEDALVFLKNAKAQKNIITSGRNLLGFILPSGEELSKEFILERFRDIAHLYYEYLIFNNPDREVQLRKKQEFFLEETEVENVDDENFSTDILDQYDVDDYYNNDELY